MASEDLEMITIDRGNLIIFLTAKNEYLTFYKMFKEMLKCFVAQN